MIACRTIHDELNIFKGIHTNIMFILIWLIIMGGQILITQFGGRVMVCCLDGLGLEQWLLALAIGVSSLLVNFVMKFFPDRLCPKLGKDSVDERE